MMKAFAVGVLGMLLCFVAPTPAASQEDPAASQEDPTAPVEEPAVALQDALPGDEVRKLFEGNTEVGEGMKGEEPTGRTWTAYFAADGTARRRRVDGGGKLLGTWFVDSEGRNCFQWEGKEEPKCDVIIPEGDHYLRIRDGLVRARIKIQKGNPSNL
jgi:hypothetical protein